MAMRPAFARPDAVVLALAGALGYGCAHAPRSAALQPDDAPRAVPLPHPEPAPLPPPPAEATTPATTAPQPEQPITFAAVGDIMLGSAFPDSSKGSLLPPDDGANLLAEVAPVLQAADVAFGNLEGPLLDAGSSEKCKNAKAGRCYAFRVPERYGDHLAAAGFDVLSLANNHVGDFGEVGRARTRAVLDAHGIAYSGAIGEVARLTVRGTRIALVAFSISSGTNDLRDVEGAAAWVKQLRGEADLVVVSFHGGAEGAAYQHVARGAEPFYGEDRGDLRRFAHAVVDAGAGLVLGHGPHVVRALEVYRGRLIAYSLGNFATYEGMNLSGPNGLSLVLEARVAKDGTFLEGKIHPAVQVKPGGPRWDPQGTVIPILRQLSQDDFGPTAPVIADDGTITPPPAEPSAPGA
jgi:poly-gamma-glutamate capsule biosynthesis protein CapA/YwtB (metallophosphatase superfamily)